MHQDQYLYGDIMVEMFFRYRCGHLLQNFKTKLKKIKSDTFHCGYDVSNMSEPTNTFGTRNGTDFHGTKDSDQEQQEHSEEQANPVNAANFSADSQNSVLDNMATSLQIQL